MVSRQESQQSIVRAMELSEPTEKSPKRETWGGQLEFILTCVGYAVGLGNVWRFPYLCYKNGGGAFLIPYFTMMFLVGLPLFFMELSFGQFASKGPIAIWTCSPIFKGLGWCAVIVNTIIAFYYNVIIAWCMYYLISSMTWKLPWSTCDNWWNTPQCSLDSSGLNYTKFNNNSVMVQWNETILDKNDSVGSAVRPIAVKSPTEEYFYNGVLQISSGIEELGSVNWNLAICLLVCWSIVFLVLIKGISSLGKVVYFTSIFPYVLLTCLLIRGVTLPGAKEGILFYLKPDFSRLLDATVWSDAAVQIFYSLSTCTGGLIAMASFNKFNNNCLRDSLIVPFINCGTSFYAGFVIFSVLGYMAHEKGVSVAEVASSGPGLVFVVYPEGLNTMPMAPLWSVLFFLMMLSLGFSSEFSMAECFFSSFIDEHPALRKSRFKNILFRFVTCGLLFLASLPIVSKGGYYVFTLLDSYSGGYPLLIVGCLQCIVLQYVYGHSNFADDIELMLGKRPSILFRICWCGVSPFILFAIIIFMAAQYKPLTLFETYIYPSWAMAIAWLIVALPCATIPALAVWKICTTGGTQIVQQLSQPNTSWGPALAENRSGRYMMQSYVSDVTVSSCVTLDKLDNRGLKRDSGISSHSTNVSGIDNDAYSGKIDM